jgi:hypothetical protein
LGSGIWDGKKSGSGILDKHPGSTTLGKGRKRKGKLIRGLWRYGFQTDVCTFLDL